MDLAINLQKIKYPVNYVDLTDKKDKPDLKLVGLPKKKPKKVKPGKDIGPTVGC